MRLFQIFYFAVLDKKGAGLAWPSVVRVRVMSEKGAKG
jgi:hypothetical protein